MNYRTLSTPSMILHLSLKYHHLQPSPDKKIVLKTLHSSSLFPLNILTRKAPYSFFIYSITSRDRKEQERTFLRRSFLLTTFIELYFIHSLAPIPFSLFFSHSKCYWWFKIKSCVLVEFAFLPLMSLPLSLAFFISLFFAEARHRCNREEIWFSKSGLNKSFPFMTFPSALQVESTERRGRRQVMYTHVHVLIYAISCSFIRLAFTLLELKLSHTPKFICNSLKWVGKFSLYVFKWMGKEN